MPFAMALDKHWSRNLPSLTCHLRICRSNFAKSTSKGYWKNAGFIMISFCKKVALVTLNWTLQTSMAMEILEKNILQTVPKFCMTSHAQSFCHRTTPCTRHNSQEQNGNSTWRTSASQSHYHRSGQEWVIACWVLVARTGTYVRSWKEQQL